MISWQGRKLTEQQRHCSFCPWWQQEGAIPAVRERASVNCLPLDLQYQASLPLSKAMKLSRLLQCRKHSSLSSASWETQSYLVGICHSLIEISPNREKGIKLRELFSSSLKEYCVSRCAGNVQPSCSKITVGVQWAGEIDWEVLMEKGKSEKREALCIAVACLTNCDHRLSLRHPEAI